MIDERIIGVTADFGLNVRLCFIDGTIYYEKDWDKHFHPEYYKDGDDIPIDPYTGERLPVVIPNELSQFRKYNCGGIENFRQFIKWYRNLTKWQKFLFKIGLLKRNKK